MKNLIRFIVALILGSQTLSAQEQMTLEKAISIGLDNNFGIKIAEQYIQIAEQNNTWARAGKVPTLDLNGSFTNTFVNDNNPASFLQGSYYNGSLGATVDAQWVVYNGGRVKIAKDQLTLSVSQEKLSKDQNIHSLLRTIYQQYYAVIFLQEQRIVLENNLNLSKDRLAYEATKKEFGASNSYNLLQFETAVLTDSTSMITQSQNVEVAKRNLYNSLDLSDFVDYQFRERLSVLPAAIDEEKLQEVLYEENYTLKSLEMIASLNRLNTLLSEAARKPTVTLSGSIGLAENAFKFFADNPNTGEPFPLLWSTRFNGGLNARANWNLYDGGVRKANIQTAKIQEEIDQMSLLEATAELNNQLAILTSNYNNQLELLQLSEEQINITQRNLEMTAERFKNGQLSSLDFRNVQTQSLNAAFNRVNAMYNLILTKSEIDFLVGKFEE